jgi:Flp pilus assembly protein TadG
MTTSSQSATPTRVRAQRCDERGVAAIWMCIVLFVLLGIAAVAVDLVRGLMVAQEAQNAADSAALAGVVYLPGDATTAHDTALANARENGFENGVNRVSVVAAQQADKTRLRVDVTRKVSTFFAKAIGFDTLTIHESATADYDPPIAMGSPANTFGNQPDCTNCSTSASDPYLWANVEGPLTAKQQGNAFLGKSCSKNADNCPTGGSNTDYDANGYYYTVRYNGTGAELKIDVFDAPFVWVDDGCNRDSLSALYDARVAAHDPDAARYKPGAWHPAPAEGQYCTGDTSFDSSAIPTTTQFKVLQPDNTPWNNNDNLPAICNNGVSNPVSVPGFMEADAAYNNATARQQFRKWWTLCDIASPAKGDYLVQVTTTAGNGNNNFSMRAYGGWSAFADPNVSIAGTNRMAVFANSPDASNSEFYLVRVLPSSTNRTLHLDFYDVADAGDGAGTLQVLPPPHATLNGSSMTKFTGCTYTNPSGSWTTGSLPLRNFSGTGGSDDCTVSGITSDNYQGKWVSWRVPVPQGYSCDESDPFDCWIRIRFGGFSGGVHDVTTWQANLNGNPVRIVQ